MTPSAIDVVTAALRFINSELLSISIASPSSASASFGGTSSGSWLSCCFFVVPLALPSYFTASMLGFRELNWELAKQIFVAVRDLRCTTSFGVYSLKSPAATEEWSTELDYINRSSSASN